MSKGFPVLAALFFLSRVFASEPLTVYTYDSLASKHSLGPVLQKKFEEKFGKKVKFVPFSSAGEALNQVVVEGSKTSADIVLGIDNSLAARAKKAQIFEKLDERALSGLSRQFLFDPDLYLIPFDYSYLGFVYDTDRVKSLPASLTLQEFSSNPLFRKKVVIEDPRTSSLGMGFLIWTFTIQDENSAKKFWKDMTHQLRATAPGWSGAYGLFLKKEADFVLSYTTSPAYHIENEKKHNIKCLIFPEGHYRQIEGMGVVKFSKQKDVAKKFLAFMLSPEVQKEIPTTQWMLPVITGVPLPDSFKNLPQPLKEVPFNLEYVESAKDRWLNQWTLSAVKAH